MSSAEIGGERKKKMSFYFIFNIMFSVMESDASFVSIELAFFR